MKINNNLIPEFSECEECGQKIHWEFSVVELRERYYIFGLCRCGVFWRKKLEVKDYEQDTQSEIR